MAVSLRVGDFLRSCFPHLLRCRWRGGTSRRRFRIIVPRRSFLDRCGSRVIVPAGINNLSAGRARAFSAGLHEATGVRERRDLALHPTWKGVLLLQEAIESLVPLCPILIGIKRTSGIDGSLISIGETPGVG